MPLREFLPADKVTIQLPVSPIALAQGRRAVERHLYRRVTRSDLDAIKIVVTELLANSVRHAGLTPEDSIDLVLEKRAGHVRIEVSDAGPCFERASDPHDTGGRGLMLVAGLSRRWGWEKRRTFPTCKVWSEIDVSHRPQLVP